MRVVEIALAYSKKTSRVIFIAGSPTAVNHRMYPKWTVIVYHTVCPEC